MNASDPRPFVHVAQLGARRSYAVPVALERKGMLARFCTDVYVRNALLVHAAETAKLRAIPGRHHASLPGGKVQTFEWLAIWDRVEERIRREETRELTWVRRGSRFARAVAARGFADANVAFAYTSAALEIFRAAKSRGIRTLLDHATAPLSPEMDLVEAAWMRWPAWFPRPPRSDGEGVYFDRQKREWELADTIVCNSSFLKRMIESAGGPVERCAIVPLGFETRGVGNVRRRNERLRVSFIGDDALRKGLPDFVEACRLARIPKQDVEVVGSMSLTPEGLKNLEPTANSRGRLPRADVLKLLGSVDVVVLPSVSDTFGMVILEAMAMGCVPITTPNAGAADLIEHEKSGFIVPLHAPQRIAEILDRLALDKELWASVSSAASRRARDFDLDSYGDRLASVANEALNRRSS